MNEHLNRRKFLTGTVIGTIGMTLINPLESLSRPAAKGKRVGIIGLDTSHSIAFTKMLNADSPDAKYLGYKVVAAYPYGSRTIESSASRIPGYIDQVKPMDVKIVDSIDALLKEVHVDCHESNAKDLHLEQVSPVHQAKNRPLTLKPSNALRAYTISIFEKSTKYNILLNPSTT